MFVDMCASWWIHVYVCACVCTHVPHTHRHAKARGWIWIFSLVTSYLIFVGKVSQWTGSLLIVQTSWPASPEVLPVSDLQHWDCRHEHHAHFYVAQAIWNQVFMCAHQTLYQLNCLSSPITINFYKQTLSIPQLLTNQIICWSSMWALCTGRISNVIVGW